MRGGEQLLPIPTGLVFSPGTRKPPRPRSCCSWRLMSCAGRWMGWRPSPGRRAEQQPAPASGCDGCFGLPGASGLQLLGSQAVGCGCQSTAQPMLKTSRNKRAAKEYSPPTSSPCSHVQCRAEFEARRDAEVELERLRAEVAFIKEAKVRALCVLWWCSVARAM